MIQRIYRAVWMLIGVGMALLDLVLGKKSAYRAKLQAAARRGDTQFLDREVEKNQLTSDDLNRLAEHHKPLEEWPDRLGDDDLLSDDAFTSDPPHHRDRPAVHPS